MPSLTSPKEKSLLEFPKQPIPGFHATPRSARKFVSYLTYISPAEMYTHLALETQELQSTEAEMPHQALCLQPEVGVGVGQWAQTPPQGSESEDKAPLCA